MVGTKPTFWPAVRQPRTAARREAASVTVCMVEPSAEAVFDAGKALFTHVLDVGTDGALDGIASGEEVFREFRSLARGQAEQVVHHQDLAVAIQTRTDTDHG